MSKPHNQEAVEDIKRRIAEQMARPTYLKLLFTLEGKNGPRLTWLTDCTCLLAEIDRLKRIIAEAGLSAE